MIFLSGQRIAPEHVLNSDQLNPAEQKIIEAMLTSPARYDYSSMRELSFETSFRNHTIQSATALIHSGAKFATFAKTYGNDMFWRRSPEGALELRYNVPAALGIRDIFERGSLYAFECATAIVVIFYFALLRMIGDQAFNAAFPTITLYDWHYEKLPVYSEIRNDFLPGDCLYFANPDFDPARPEWRGENAIYFGYDQFAAFGLGILTAEQVIQRLNSFRKRGATQSAYLMSHVTRVDIPELLSRIQR